MNRTEEVANEIRNALEKLGYKKPKFEFAFIDNDRCRVSMDGIYFGVYDTNRKTFVD